MPFEPDLHRASAADYNSNSALADNQFTLAHQIDSYIRATLESRNIDKAKANESLQRLPTYQIGDIVYLKAPPHSSTPAYQIPNSPFQYTYRGPFRVKKTIGPVNYLIENVLYPTKSPEVVHVQRLERGPLITSPETFSTMTPENTDSAPSATLTPTPIPTATTTTTSTTSLPPEIKPTDSAPSNLHTTRSQGVPYRPNYNESLLSHLPSNDANFAAARPSRKK